MAMRTNLICFGAFLVLGATGCANPVEKPEPAKGVDVKVQKNDKGTEVEVDVKRSDNKP